MKLRWIGETRTFACEPESLVERSILEEIKAKTYGTFNKQRQTYYIHEVGWPFLYQKVGHRSDILKKFLKKREPRHAEVTIALANGHALRESQILPVLRKMEGACGDFDDMGVGKTASSLAAYRELKKRKSVDGMLVIAPSSVLGEWVDAAKKFLSEDAYVIKAGRTSPPREGILAISYSSCWRVPYVNVIMKALRSRRYILVLDEAHHLAGWSSKQFQACETWARFCRWRWVLTGTPVANYPDSFWPLYRIITQASIDRDAFIKYHTWDGAKLYREDRLNLFRKYIAPQWSWRREKHEVLDLPPKTIVPISIEFTGDQEKAYRKLLDEAVLLVQQEGEWTKKKVESTLALYTKLLQLASHPMLCDAPGRPTAKLEALMDKLQGAGTQKVVVWSWRPKTIEYIEDAIRKQMGWEVASVHGGTPLNKRTAIKDALTNGSLRCLVANPKAFGAGVNLQAASLAIYWDLHWSYTEWKQSQDRIYRQGQTRNVTIYVLLSSFEKIIHERLLTKESLGTALFGKDEIKFDSEFEVAKDIAAQLMSGGHR